MVTKKKFQMVDNVGLNSIPETLDVMPCTEACPEAGDTVGTEEEGV